MPIEPTPLPYPTTALQPHVPADTIERLRAQQLSQIQALQTLLVDHPLQDLPLEELVRNARGKLAEQAAQAWNEDFFWTCIRPVQAGIARAPRGKLAEVINGQFGTLEALQEQFSATAIRAQAPAWIWLVQRRNGHLAILATPSSVTPLTGEDTPLLAYNMDEDVHPSEHPDNRLRCVTAFWQVLDWPSIGTRIR